MHVALKWPRNRGIRDFYHSFCVFSILTCVQALLLGGVARSHARADCTQKETRSLATRNGELARAQATSIPEYDHSDLL